MQVLKVSRGDPRVQALISQQKAFAEAHTPPNSGHAVEVGSDAIEAVTYWLAVDGDEGVGCIGLKALDEKAGEIKTMHVLESQRGRGIAQALMHALTDEAQKLGLSVLKLETGKSEGFAASRRFYEKAGFDYCEPFGPYRADPFSVCMSRELI